jgi:hypothetical protein
VERRKGEEVTCVEEVKKTMPTFKDKCNSGNRQSVKSKKCKSEQLVKSGNQESKQLVIQEIRNG